MGSAPTSSDLSNLAHCHATITHSRFAGCIFFFPQQHQDYSEITRKLKPFINYSTQLQNIWVNIEKKLEWICDKSNMNQKFPPLQMTPQFCLLQPVVPRCLYRKYANILSSSPAGNLFLRMSSTIWCLLSNLLSLFAVGWLRTSSLFHDIRLQTTVSAINSWVSQCPSGLSIIIKHVLQGFMLLYLAHYSVLTNQLMSA